MSPLFDTHCHFDFDAFSNTDEALATAKQSGVERILIPSIGLSNWDKVSLLASNHSELYFSLGLHPYFIDQHLDTHLEQLDDRLSHRGDKCVAVGECGLDFYSGDGSKMKQETQAKQEAIFQGHIALAKRHQLPLILHQRKSHQLMVSMLKQSQFDGGGVIHGFSGSFQQAKDWIDLGFAIGVGGTITYPRAQKTRNTIAQLPLDSLVLETDAPDMPICGYQGKPNHPKYLPQILECLAVLKKRSKQTIAPHMWSKSNFVFGICE
ncbi:TatD family hydrolase [Vibrio sp. S9_S30]|uniref:TatD family hydrolase n=1 Tax=Vibrio sp. S9_S30 TaxID=2720226 RepID=UPI0016803777|nr:TatD family hydrolase [Vibrio sp. S9_S30]MBD1555641.1 TatD family hydrolase [Vibrio sp. S9_S30]